MQIDHETWIVVADGAKFLLLRNAGDRDFINLEVVAHESDATAPARALSSDRAGRRYDATRPATGGGVRPSGRSAMEETDWHRVAEDRFAEEIAARLRRWASDGRFQRLVVVAAPRTLGALRKSYGDDLARRVTAEIDKDLTNLPLDGIEASILAHRDAAAGA